MGYPTKRAETLGKLVGATGFAPSAARAARRLKPSLRQTQNDVWGFGRGDWIRTSDPLRPRQVRYQAALRPDPCRSQLYHHCSARDPP